MANFATALKEEIARLSRKEVRAEIESLKKASSKRRKDVADLKREVVRLTRKVALLENKVLDQKSIPVSQDSDKQMRFTAKGLKSQRNRLSLSADDYGKLVGVTGISIYNWENGKTKPRKAQLAVLAALRGMGKKEAIARLMQLDKPKPGPKPASESGKRRGRPPGSRNIAKKAASTATNAKAAKKAAKKASTKVAAKPALKAKKSTTKAKATKTKPKATAKAKAATKTKPKATAKAKAATKPKVVRKRKAAAKASADPNTAVGTIDNSGQNPDTKE